jgi:predicted RNase H-like HicB family nuclease
MKVKEIIDRNYPIRLHFINEEDGDGYWMAYLPDFGWSACSATADTIQEALDMLKEIQKEIVECYLKRGKKIPEPSLFNKE